MRRDAVRQLRTVAGHQAAAIPQEEVTGISGGKEVTEARRPADAPREGVVLLHAVVRHDRRRLRLGVAVPRAAVRGPGRVHAAGRLRAGAGAVHDRAPRTAGRPVQLHVELVPGGMHQRRVQLQSHIRGVHDGRWRRRRRRRGHRRSPRPAPGRRRRWPARPGGRTAGQHQGLRLSARRGLRQFQQVVRVPGRQIPVPLFPAEPHAGRGRLRQTATVHRHCPLFRGAVHRLRAHVHRAVRHALRLSVFGRGKHVSDGGGCRTTGIVVQEFGRTFAHRRIQVQINTKKI